MSTIPSADTKKISRLLRDLECECESADYFELFDRLHIVLWSKYSGDEKCSFCEEPAFHSNKFAKMYACETCMYDLENGEVDVFHPEDHPVSLKLLALLRDLVDTTCWTETSPEEYFIEHGITYNNCHVCHLPIDYGRVAIAFDAKAVAHYSCAREHGFRNHFTNYEKFFNNVPQLISDLAGTPFYSPPISKDDLQKLCALVKSHLPLFDYSSAMGPIHLFHHKYWTYKPSSIRCTFCPNSSLWRNECLRVDSCDTCLTDAINVTPLTTPFYFIMHKIRDLLLSSLRINMKARDLISNFITYDRCQICKKVLESDDDIAVGDKCIVHLTCCTDPCRIFNSDLPIETLINLPNFIVHFNRAVAALRED